VLPEVPAAPVMDSDVDACDRAPPSAAEKRATDEDLRFLARARTRGRLPRGRAVRRRCVAGRGKLATIPGHRVIGRRWFAGSNRGGALDGTKAGLSPSASRAPSPVGHERRPPRGAPRRTGVRPDAADSGARAASPQFFVMCPRLMAPPSSASSRPRARLPSHASRRHPSQQSLHVPSPKSSQSHEPLAAFPRRRRAALLPSDHRRPRHPQ
jgi:hypothetical protein